MRAFLLEQTVLTLFFGWLRGILMIGFVGDKKRIFG